MVHVVNTFGESTPKAWEPCAICYLWPGPEIPGCVGRPGTSAPGQCLNVQGDIQDIRLLHEAVAFLSEAGP